MVGARMQTRFSWDFDFLLHRKSGELGPNHEQRPVHGGVGGGAAMKLARVSAYDHCRAPGLIVGAEK
jgi:hypothetical protein